MKTYGSQLRALTLALLLTGCSTFAFAADQTPQAAQPAPVQQETKAAAPQTAGTTTAAPVKAAQETPAARKEAATIHTDPLAGRSDELIKKYYLTDGSAYTKTTELVKSLSSDLTGLSAKESDYYLRVDKKLTDKYFRHVRAYDKTTHVQQGEFHVAKDQSSVWRVDGEQPGMIYGSAEKLLKKCRLVVYPRYLALGGKGLVRLETPGNVPYELKAKSLNDAIAHVDEQNNIQPLSTGKADIMVDYTLGDQKGTVVRQISVVTKEDLQRMAYAAYMSQLYMDMMWYNDPWPYWGYWGPHHHHHGHRPPPPPRHGHRPPPPHHHR